MNRFLYEKSVSDKGYLIIPFLFSQLENEAIYSYQLLSELGYQGKLHQAENPAGIHSNRIESIINIAKYHLAQNSDIMSSVDYFKCRYTYRHNLIIVHDASNKYFYDHYKPKSLNNVAAPKLFQSEQDCITWIKQGLDRSDMRENSEII